MRCSGHVAHFALGGWLGGPVAREMDAMDEVDTWTWRVLRRFACPSGPYVIESISPGLRFNRFSPRITQINTD